MRTRVYNLDSSHLSLDLTRTQAVAICEQSLFCLLSPVTIRICHSPAQYLHFLVNVFWCPVLFNVCPIFDPVQVLPLPWFLADCS